MPSRSPSKQRLEELIALARTYRGWSNKDLARELGRDAHHLVPNSGVPKLDIVLALAEALDWTVQDVVDDLCGNAPDDSGDAPPETWERLNRSAWEALQAGEYAQVALIARKQFSAARTGEQRAVACLRELGAWEGLGRYQVAMDCVQRGLRESGVTSETVLLLRNNLATLHYLLGNYDESIGIATATVYGIDASEFESQWIDGSLAYARYVRGVTVRAMLAAGRDPHPGVVQRAQDDLRCAAVGLRAAASRDETPSYSAVAFIAEGAELGLGALSGERSGDEVIETYLAYLDEIREMDLATDKPRAEPTGWWCVFGCEVAARTVKSPERREQLLGIFTNKVNEVAAIIGNWALRERVWYYELLRHQTSSDESAQPWLLDEEDARELSGAMARFPNFRKIGWQVLRSAQIGGNP